MRNAVLALFFLALAAQFYSLVPKYPDGHENVSLKRQLVGGLVHSFFRGTVLAERLGLINDSADIVQWLFFKRVTEQPSSPDVLVEKTTIGDLPVVIFRPRSIKSTSSKAIIYFHGGGFALGSPSSHFSWTLRLANSTESIVISVDYPLAPRHPFPAAMNACIKVTKAIFDASSSLGIDRKRIAVAGDSAGGNFAAVVALELADSVEYKLKAQILISPALVAAGVSALPSYVHYSSLFMIHLDWFIVKYAGLRYTSSIERAITSEHHISIDQMNAIKPFLNISSLPDDLLALIPDRAYANGMDAGATEEDMKNRPPEVAAIGELALNQRAWPLIVEDEQRLSRLAPILIQVCQFDPLRDEGLLYFNRLRKLGVPSSLSFLPNAIHAEPLFRDITGAVPSISSLKGLQDIVIFVARNL